MATPSTKISLLPVATDINSTDYMLLNQEAGTRKVTVDQMNTLALSHHLAQLTVESIAALRLLEPATDVVTVYVQAYYATWRTDKAGPVGGGLFYADKGDTTTTDDGIFTFVSAGGTRWKRKLDGVTYNLAMAGIRSGDDATAALTKMIAFIQAKFTATTAPVASGTPPVYGTKSLIDYGNTTIEVYPGKYVISSCVQIPTVVSLVALGNITWDGRTVAAGQTAIFKISNDNFLVAYTPKYFSNGPVLNGAFGTHNILGNKTVPGVSIGNTMDGCVNCFGWLIDNATMSYTTSFIEFTGSHDTYLCHFSQISGYGASGNGIDFLRVTFSNSGERMSFKELTVGGCDGNLVYVSKPGLMLAFTDASFDLCNGDMMQFGSNAQNVTIDFVNAHTEGFDGVMFRTNTATNNRISWRGGQILPTSRTRGALDNYQGRPLISGSLAGVQLRDTAIYSTYPADGAGPFIGYPTDTTTPRKFEATGIINSYGLVGSQYDIANIGYDFSSETVGTVLNGSNSTLTKFVKPDNTTYWLAGGTATVVTLSDGTTALQFVPTTTGLVTNYIALTTTDYIPVQPARTMIAPWAVCQPLLSALRLRVQCAVRWYDADKNYLGSTATGGTSDIYTNSQITTLPSYSTNATTNGNRKMATSAPPQLAIRGAAYARPHWTISGLDQTININQLCCAVVY